ncbi:MAG: hypothetical protein E7242_08265 [Lachnospiraceae bacterium]|nr:hypothetical protein [Lachnospiraceae bacterium]
MKKALLILLCVLPIAIFAGCENDSASSRNNDNKSDVEKVLEAGMSEENASTDSNGDNAGTGAKASTNSTPAEGVDVDLTVMSSTMVYSEVLNMMTTPEDYIGKVIKMEGIYATYHDDASGNNYYACIIQDATACCAQGIEFILSDGNYPEDTGQILSVVGTFDTYEENGVKYCTLRDATLV